MKSMLFVLLLSLISSCTFGQTESDIRSRLIGTWKLVSAEETLKDGSTRPFPAFGSHSKGFLMYQRDGYMCADLVNPDRPKWADSAHKTNEEKIAAGEGTFAYCGRYEINVEQKQIVHLPEVATDPGYVGSRQIRPYRFEEDKLILGDVEKQDPAVVRWKIVWQKLK